MERRTAYEVVNKLTNKINREGDDEEDKYVGLVDGSIVFNLRNRRYYEYSLQRSQSPYSRFWHLSSTTARMVTVSKYGTYCWGPRLFLPPTHPFVQKRINARLAERLEGKE